MKRGRCVHACTATVMLLTCVPAWRWLLSLMELPTTPPARMQNASSTAPMHTCSFLPAFRSCIRATLHLCRLKPTAFVPFLIACRPYTLRLPAIGTLMPRPYAASHSHTVLREAQTCTCPSSHYHMPSVHLTPQAAVSTQLDHAAHLCCPHTPHNMLHNMLLPLSTTTSQLNTTRSQSGC